MRSPDGRDIVRTELLNFDWTLKTDISARFILGDTGMLYNKGDMQNVAVPLSRGMALYLTPSYSPKLAISFMVAADHDIKSLNLESAARSRRWIVGDRTELDRLRSQVGSSPLPASGQR